MINFNNGKPIKYPLRLKLFLVAAVIIIPMIILSVYQISVLHNYSTAYDAIVRRVTSALSSIIIASVLVNFLVTDSITKPIKVLCHKTAMVARGDFTTRITCENRDELSILSDSFNNMAFKLEQQVNSIRMEQENLRYMESKLLQAQINPHFLYNTLDTIIWLIEGNKYNEAIDMVVSLSEFFRIIVSKGKDFITIREEEIHIKSYLQIQQSRYKDILDFEINIPKVLYGYEILKMTLQPLIENSIYHGIKMLRARGKITVTGEMVDEIIRFHVIDNGIGMDEAELDNLRIEVEIPASKKSTGFGLANVNKRIKLNYGNTYGLEIQSKKGVGTDIIIKIPARPLENERIEVGYE